MRITTLIENTRLENRKDLKGEPGLSLHVEAGGRRIQFDTGVSGAFAENAARLGIDVRRADAAVISHHHYDHGGGLAAFLERNREARVFLRRCGESSFSFRAFGLVRRPIGIDWDVLRPYSDRLVFIDETTEILPGVFLVTEIEDTFPRPKGNRFLFSGEGRDAEPDRFEHELIMIIREDDAMTVFTGCSHSGLLNMVDTAVKMFPGIPVRAVLGGFHLMGLPRLNTMAGTRKEVEEIGEIILRYPVEKVYTGHCTGRRAFRVLKSVMGERLEYLPTGRVVEV